MTRAWASKKYKPQMETVDRMSKDLKTLKMYFRKLNLPDKY